MSKRETWAAIRRTVCLQPEKLLFDYPLENFMDSGEEIGVARRVAEGLCFRNTETARSFDIATGVVSSQAQIETGAGEGNRFMTQRVNGWNV